MEDQTEKVNSTEITIDDIVSLFKNYSDKKKARDIKKLLKEKFATDMFADENVDLAVEKLLKEDKAKGKRSELTYSSPYYQKRRSILPPPTPNPTDSRFFGTAGECAVMSELLFHGYNVNRMMVDEGVDLIAVKDNIYYYIQVKTTNVEKGRVYVQIKNYNFDKYMGNQMRYFIVARSKDSKGNPKNIFFKFSQEDIDKGLYGRYIKQGESCISIKILFDKSGDPKLYDETRECEISWNMNNFNL